MRKLNKKESVLFKHGGKCAYCGMANLDLTIDHIIPRSQGGNNDISNLQPSCRSCNSSKGTRSLDDFILHQNYLEIANKHGFSAKQLRFLTENTNFSEVFVPNGYVPYFMKGSRDE